eukprot:CAMPEP_0116836986 /NCGR_PEP_ID=MMETSP0418-20121206/8406_1 /TAXON_ID=1158023 /ORGANISM="Astrosyne radiata, Strain 13vi08-1A" /LENGTH=92 /DNA_ID=CAMNT_0004466827 /DNA_START=241 /DNA_END=520 /DNA_ORIENTATION=+
MTGNGGVVSSTKTNMDKTQVHEALKKKCTAAVVNNKIVLVGGRDENGYAINSTEVSELPEEFLVGQQEEISPVKQQQPHSPSLNVTPVPNAA